MSDYFTMTTYDKGHLLMCEKEDLVEYIECLRLDVKHEKQEKDEVWEQCAKVTAEKINLLTENKKLKEQRKPLTRSDTRIKQLEEQIEILKIESVYEKCVVKEMKSIIKILNDECGGLKERLVDMSFKVDELESQIELTDECVIDGLKQGHKDLQEENEKLKEENEKILGIMSSYDTADDVSNELDRLSEIETCIWCDLWGYDCVEHDTKLYRLQYEFKELKKLKEENEKLKEFINQQKVTVVKLDQHGQELNK